MAEFEESDVTPEAADDGVGGGERGIRRRRRVLVAVMAAAVALAGGGVAASTMIKSPAQAAAESEPPAPDVLTAAVEKRVLTDSVVVRGQVSAGQSVDVAPAGGGGAAGAKPVVTRLPAKAGDQVRAGQSVLEVAGRPVFPLRGDLPVYRDLKPGATGQDVKQLQQALKELGFDSGGDAEGTFGAGTKEAVKAFYAARGYDPLPAAPDGDAQVTAAQDAVTGGERALADARDALRLARKRHDDAVAADRQQSRQQAQQSAAPATGAATGAATGGAAPAPVGESPVDAARTAVDTARKQVTRATEDLAKLRKKVTDAKASTGPMVPAAELLFLSGFPARVDSVAGRIGGEVSGKVLTVSAGALVVKGGLTIADKGLVRPGQVVEILSEVTGVKAAGTVGAVADTPGDGQPAAAAPGAGAGGGQNPAPVQGGAASGYAMVVQPDAPLDPRLAGQDVRLTVQAASSAGPVLVVPLSAVSATADGRTVVTVYENGQRRRVEVTPGTVGGGSAEVRPLTGGTLKPGDRVIVGVKDATGAGAR
ncbi:peptidoglycan-binding domain-containing protein [Kitasatospora sp. NPDC001527]|uniref:peptidoglycan-binding domain-containing protein n=1 Tax=Kitasatospora sp. NPDC001527 TaxID=3154519 RepID=UPI003328FBD8